MIYELRYTREYKKQFDAFATHKRDILKVHNKLTVNPFSGKFKRVKMPKLLNYYVTEYGGIKIFWKAMKGNVIVLAGITKR